MGMVYCFTINFQVFINNDQQPHNCVRPSCLGYLIFALHKLANQLKLLYTHPPPPHKRSKYPQTFEFLNILLLNSPLQLYSAKNTVQIHEIWNWTKIICTVCDQILHSLTGLWQMFRTFVLGSDWWILRILKSTKKHERQSERVTLVSIYNNIFRLYHN